MFEISGKLTLEQSDEILGVSQISWGSHQSFVCQGLHVLVKQNAISNTGWERQLEWFKDSSQNRTMSTIDGEPMEFELNIPPGFTTLELVREVQKFMFNMGEPEQFQGRIIFMSMFNEITRGNKKQ